MNVSKSYTLFKIKYRVEIKSDSIIQTKWCLQNDSGIGSPEYTICGLATPDSTLKMEDFEATGHKSGGTITCPDCLRHLNWCKKVK